MQGRLHLKPSNKNSVGTNGVRVILDGLGGVVGERGGVPSQDRDGESVRRVRGKPMHLKSSNDRPSRAHLTNPTPR